MGTERRAWRCCRRLGHSPGSRSADADPFGVLVVQNFEGVAVEDGDDGAGEVGKRGIGTNKEGETCQ